MMNQLTQKNQLVSEEKLPLEVTAYGGIGTFIDSISVTVDQVAEKYASHDGSTASLDAAANAPDKSFSRLEIGPIAIDQFSQTALVDEILHHALVGEGTRQVITANAQFYVLAQKSRRFRACLAKAEYICADGMPIAWACNSLFGGRVRRIAGVNLIEKICRCGAAYNLRLFLLGGKSGTGNTTAAVLARRYPGIQIVGINCPPYGFERHEESLKVVLNHIVAAKPHILFVGLGAPKQEFFIDRYVRSIGIPLAIGIGGSFELLSGNLKRAPQWMQGCGLEWAYRLGQEPKRLCKRYLIGNAEFIWHIGHAKLSSILRREDIEDLSLFEESCSHSSD